jgi:hypothetical protein
MNDPFGGGSRTSLLQPGSHETVNHAGISVHPPQQRLRTLPEES